MLYQHNSEYSIWEKYDGLISWISLISNIKQKYTFLSYLFISWLHKGPHFQNILPIL